MSNRTVRKSKSTKSVRLGLTMNHPSKQAGCNRLSITIPSNDWRIADQRVSLSIRDAEVIRRFLNDNLGE
jgi:hypothetical protein